MRPRFVHPDKQARGIRPPGENGAADTPSPDASHRDAIEKTLALAVPAAMEPAPLHAFVHEAVGKVLLQRSVPASELQAPDKQLYLSAIDALRYSRAAEAIIHIIATSMDARVAHRVLPAYIEVIKQVSRDELEIIRSLPKIGRSSPITHINLVLPSQHAVVVYRNVIPGLLAEVCEFRDNIPQYIDNLVRLGVLAFRAEDEASASTYRTMARLGFIKQILVGAPAGSRIAMSPSAIALTDLGEGLRRACFE